MDKYLIAAMISEILDLIEKVKIIVRILGILIADNGGYVEDDDGVTFIFTNWCWHCYDFGGGWLLDNFFGYGQWLWLLLNY